jgi:hypothetical protein
MVKRLVIKINTNPKPKDLRVTYRHQESNLTLKKINHKDNI